MKTSREQFEDWFADNMFIGSKCIADAATKRRMLRAWQASRQCIEVELPERISSLNMHNGSAIIEATHYDDAIYDCEERIKNAGIKVKGA